MQCYTSLCLQIVRYSCGSISTIVAKSRTEDTAVSLKEQEVNLRQLQGPG